MPLRIFVGPDVPRLLAQAQHEIGADAVVLATRRIVGAAGVRFELTAADPAAAAAAAEAARPAAAPASRPAPAPARAWPALAAPQAGGPRILALVGPTGAGKTTTLAKLANHPDAFGGRRVGLLCLDTYRVGAVEQARIYAELSRLPFEAVHEPGDTPRALRRLRGCDVVLVDTAGRGPAAARDLDETGEALARIGPGEVHLVLPAGLRADQARRVVAAWKARGATHVLPTKLDECPDDPTPFDLALHHRLRVRWSCDGQEVPADLHAVTGDLIAAARRARERDAAGVAA